jgi:serine/threonine-protein kinase RsbW
MAADEMKSSRSVAFAVTADMDRLPQIMQAVSDAMNASGFSPQETFEVQLAVEEACTNIIRHAYEGRTGFIYISILTEKDKLKILIEDNGPPFDPTEHTTMRRRGQDDIEGPVGGWGIGLIRAVMDEMTYMRNSNRNILCLGKRRFL